MKKGSVFFWRMLVMAFGVTAVVFMTISCGTFKAIHEDEVIAAELVLDDNDWVVLTIKNNSALQIQLLADKAHYSNFGTGVNTILVPLSENINPGTKVVPIPIPAGRTVVQRFVAPAYVEYKRGKMNNINNWTPRGKNAIKTASFDFEYEIEGESKHFIFEGNLFH